MFDWFWETRRKFKYYRRWNEEYLAGNYGLFSRKYPYDKYPDGTHFVYKNLVAIKTGFILGFGTWMSDVLHLTRARTAAACLKLVPRHMGIGMLGGGAWASTIWCLTNFRGKDDWLNYLGAAFPCGVIIALRNGRFTAGLVFFMFMGTTGTIWRMQQDYGIKYMCEIKKCRGDFDRMNDRTRSEPYNGWEEYYSVDEPNLGDGTTFTGRRDDYRMPITKYFHRKNTAMQKRIQEDRERAEREKKPDFWWTPEMQMVLEEEEREKEEAAKASS